MSKEQIRRLRQAAAEARERGRLEKALDAYLELERLEPRDASWPQRAAECYRQLGKGREQQAALERAATGYADRGFTLKAVANNEAKGFKIRDPYKLKTVAEHLGIAAEGRPILDVANDVADTAIAEFGQQTGEPGYLRPAPTKPYHLGADNGAVPRRTDPQRAR